jgi:hypothetical protein
MNAKILNLCRYGISYEILNETLQQQQQLQQILIRIIILCEQRKNIKRVF